MAEASPRVLLHTRQASAEKVVEFPNLVTGKLGRLIESASAAGTLRELVGEQDARLAFRSEVARWPKTRRFRWRNPAAVVVATSASFLIATSSLAAATGFPAPAARVVDKVLSQVGITDPSASPGGSSVPNVAPEMPPTPGGSPAASGSAIHPHVMTPSVCTGHSAGKLVTSSQSNGPGQSGTCGHRQSTIGRPGPTRRGPGASPTGSQGVGNLGSAGVATGTGAGAGSGVGTPEPGSSNQGSGSGGSPGAGSAQGTDAATGTNQGGNQGTGGGTGTNRGGNQGTGTATGTNRGGNQGTGGGTGTNRGGNQGTGGGTGTKRGGKRGGGTSRGSAAGHRHKGAPSRIPGGPGSPSTTASVSRGR